MQVIAGGHLQTSCRTTAGEEPIPMQNYSRHPHEFFRVLSRVAKTTQGLAKLFVSFGANRKAETTLFTTLRPVKKLFSLLSGLTGGANCEVLQEDSYRDESWQ